MRFASNYVAVLCSTVQFSVGMQRKVNLSAFNFIHSNVFTHRHVSIVQTITRPTDLDLCQCPMIMIVTLKRDVSCHVSSFTPQVVTCPVSLHKWSRVRWSLLIPHHVQWTHGDSRTMGTLHNGQAGARCQAVHKADLDADCYDDSSLNQYEQNTSSL